MTRLILLLVTLIAPAQAFAGNLVYEAKIVRLASSYNGTADDFFIEVSGGGGPCANGGIVFPRSLAPSDGFFSRMFAIALTAYTTENVRVRVYTPSGTDCNTALFIEIQG